MKALVPAGRIIPARAGFTVHGGSPRSRPGDHPRSRGVYMVGQFQKVTSPGSSPLARGLPVVGDAERPVGGIIPARAGFTPTWAAVSPATGDHPRSRGVYMTGRLGEAGRAGSSPLARGLRGGGAPAASACGIIPARAGFTDGDAPTEEVAAGSSPLARGLRRDDVPLNRTDRIIPARAGFTARGCPAASPGPDHPRSRGVYDGPPGVGVAGEGSSPLARGLRREGWVILPGLRIIPARAGFTPPHPAAPGRTSDHPRSRGVYGLTVAGWVAWMGSSPLARGLLSFLVVGTPPVRIIPARAGFTPVARRVMKRWKDHPRSRGVYFWLRYGYAMNVGSSPLARGLRILRD